MREALNRALVAAGVAACLTMALVSCGSNRQGGSTPSPDSMPPAPSARDGQHGAALPLVAGRWPKSSGHHPPESLTWRRAPLPQSESRLSADVAGPEQPWYASFMTHKTVNRAGIPDESPENQRVLACGQGIAKPGCRITSLGGHRWRIETLAPAPQNHPYRILYVQWPSGGPGEPENWASWQLPTP